jgi:hypothetical protein
MTADGTLPAFYVGRSVRLDPQDVADWLRMKRFPVRQGRDEKHLRKRKIPNPNRHGRDDEAVYRILRSKVLHLEAAAAIDDSSNGQASDKTSENV